MRSDESCCIDADTDVGSLQIYESGAHAFYLFSEEFYPHFKSLDYLIIEEGFFIFRDDSWSGRCVFHVSRS